MGLPNSLARRWSTMQVDTSLREGSVATQEDNGQFQSLSIRALWTAVGVRGRRHCLSQNRASSRLTIKGEEMQRIK